VSGAIAGPGFLLQLGSTAGDSGTFTTIAEVKDISGPGITLDTTDVTNQDSPNKFEEIIPSIRRGGEVDFDVHFIPGTPTQNGTTGLVYLANNAIKRGYRLQTQDGHGNYWAFDAYVINFMPKAPVVGVMTATVKLKVTGKPTIVHGAS
jgi:hypothetical protein